MKAREIEACAERLPEHLRAPFSEYMAEGVEFDMVEVQLVYDLRPLNLVWRQQQFHRYVKLPEGTLW